MPIVAREDRMADWMQCDMCGEDLFEPDEDGMFWEETKTCQECGVISWVNCDGEYAHASTDEHAEDVGQPRCDNACGLIYTQSPKLVAEFMGSPCRWDCEKAKPFIAALKAS